MQVPARHGHARIQCFPSQAVRHSWLSELEYLWSSSPPDGRPRDHPDLLEWKRVGRWGLLRKGVRLEDVRHDQARPRQLAEPVAIRAVKVDLGAILVREDDGAPVEVAPLQVERAVAGDGEHWRGPGEGEQASRSEHAANLAECTVDVLDEPEGIRRERDVEARIGEHRKVFDVRFNEPDLDLLRFRKGPRMGELCGREVDSRDPGSLFGEVYSRLPTAAGNFQNVLSRNVRAEDLQLPFRRHRRPPQHVVLELATVALLVGATRRVPVLAVRPCMRRLRAHSEAMDGGVLALSPVAGGLVLEFGSRRASRSS